MIRPLPKNSRFPHKPQYGNRQIMNNFHKQPPLLTILTALAAERKILANPPAADITIRQCGMGCESAYRQVSELSAGTMLGNIGVSGGMAPGLAPGTIILVDGIYNQCFRLSCLKKSYHLNVALMDMLEAVLREQGIGYRRGMVLCVDEPLLTPADKAKAHDRTGALAVDMESAGVAEAALRKGLPFFCLRVICDPAKRGVERELLQGVDDRGNSRPFHLMAAVCRQPRLFFGLLRMAGDFSQAAAGMRRAWDVIRQPLLDFSSAESAARSPDGNGQGL